MAVMVSKPSHCPICVAGAGPAPMPRPTRSAALWADAALADTALANADITGTAHAGRWRGAGAAGRALAGGHRDHPRPPLTGNPNVPPQAVPRPTRT